MMKKSRLNIFIKSLFIVFAFSAIACFRMSTYVPPPSPRPADDVYAQNDNNNNTFQSAPDAADYQTFYDELSPYGNWIDYPEYGYVWIPRVTVDFHPYATDGHWVMTNYGWTWVSDFRWGWAAFHYGRWAYEPIYGWLWIPGHIWGPAWVAWRESNDYFGWAPLGPHIDIAININIGCPFDHYRFIPRRYFTHKHPHRYYADWHNNTVYVNHTTVINETHVVNKNSYYYGPRKELVEHATGKKVKQLEVSDNPKPKADAVEKDRVRVYRPRMDEVSAEPRKTSPRIVTPASEIPMIPSDKRLTPSVRREIPKNTEGVVPNPQEKQPMQKDVPQEKIDIKKEAKPAPDPRPVDRKPRMDDVQKEKPEVKKEPIPQPEARPKNVPNQKEAPQEKPDIKREPDPKIESRPERKPRTEEAPQKKTEVKKEPPTKTEPRPKITQPRKEETIKEKPAKNNTRPVKERTNTKKEAEQPKKKNNENNE